MMMNSPKVFAAAGGSGSLDEGNYQQGVFYRVVNGKLQKIDVKTNRDADVLHNIGSINKPFKSWIGSFKIHIIAAVFVILGLTLILAAILSLISYIYTENKKLGYEYSNRTISNLTSEQGSIHQGYFPKASTVLESEVVINATTTRNYIFSNYTWSTSKVIKSSAVSKTRKLPLVRTTNVPKTSHRKKHGSKTTTVVSTTSRTTTTSTTPSTTAKPDCIWPKLMAKQIKSLDETKMTKRPILMYASNSTTACPESSVYFPSFVSLESSMMFGYPINQLVVCNNAITVLQCPIGQVINLKSVYYGIQSTTLTQCLSITEQTPSFCFNINTYQRISSSCQNKENCSIAVTTNNLGEPCFGFNKQLVVQYQCIDQKAMSEVAKCSSSSSSVSKTPRLAPICRPLTASNLQKEQVWCEPSTMSIECPRNQLIRILCGFYGIDPTHSCPGAFKSGAEPTYCYSNSSYERLIAECDGRRKCVLSGEPDFVNGAGFSNPCPGYAKILLVQWECVEDVAYEPKANHTTIQTSFETSIKSTEICSLDSMTQYDSSACPNHSPYVPSFLTNLTSSSLDYPIFQQIICNSGKLFLTCPSNLVIHVYGAYYGIQESTSVRQCMNAPNSVSQSNDQTDAAGPPKQCFFADTFTKIQASCESQSLCLIEASVNKFGDPCPRLNKQLFVQYQCMDRVELKSLNDMCSETNTNRQNIPFTCPEITVQQKNYTQEKVQERTWCDGSTMFIQCDGDGENYSYEDNEYVHNSNKTIEILCAFYGIHTSLTSCNIQNLANPPICFMGSSFEIMSSLCNGNSTCTLDHFTSTFPDPCMGYDKALYVQWICK